MTGDIANMNNSHIIQNMDSKIDRNDTQSEIPTGTYSKDFSCDRLLEEVQKLEESFLGTADDVNSNNIESLSEVVREKLKSTAMKLTIIEMKKEMADLKSAHDIETKKLQNKLTELKNENLNLTQSNEDLKIELKYIKHEKSSLEIDHALDVQKIEKLGLENKNLVERNANLEWDCNHYKKLRVQDDEIRIENQKLTEEVLARRGDKFLMKEYAESNSKYIQNISKLKKKKDDLKDALERAEREIEELRKLNRSLTSSITKDIPIANKSGSRSSTASNECDHSFECHVIKQDQAQEIANLMGKIRLQNLMIKYSDDYVQFLNAKFPPIARNIQDWDDASK